MSITLSDSAAARVNAFLANRGKGFGLRLGVRTSGCSGMAYVLEFVDEPAAEDTVFEDKGVKVVIDGKSLQFLDGTQLDFVKEGLNEGFKFTNPNVKDECGCGESFNVLSVHPNPTAVTPRVGFSFRCMTLRLLWTISPSSGYQPAIPSRLNNWLSGIRICSASTIRINLPARPLRSSLRRFSIPPPLTRPGRRCAIP